MQCSGFIESMASVDDPAMWQELEAGFMTMRAVQDAFAERTSAPQMIEKARGAARQLARTPVRNRLVGVLDRIGCRPGASEPRSRHEMAVELLAFGVDLRDSGQIAPANDVFHFVATNFADDYETRMEALQKQAYGLRLMAKWIDCRLAYSLMRSLAVESGDDRAELNADLGQVFVDIELGSDLEAAQTAVTRILRRARAAKIGEMIGRALATLAVVAGRLKDPVTAIVATNEAMDYITRRATREHNLHSMSVAFREAGHTRAAIEIAEHLIGHADEEYVRTMARLHRYNLAIDEGDELHMARLAGALATAPKTPEVEFAYHEAMARGYAAGHKFVAAEKQAIDALIVAKAHGMNELASRAEAALEDIRRKEVPVVYQYRPQKITTAAKRKLAAVEKNLRSLCTV